MVSGKVTVKNPTGLHLRPAGTLCKQAMQFKSSITFHYGDGNTANAKSVLSVLGACVKCGDEIELFCEGEARGGSSAVPCQFHPDGTWGRTVRRKNNEEI